VSDRSDPRGDLIDAVDNPLVDQLADSIRVGVMTGRFPIGSYLRQSALAEVFGVSRTPIREALRKLQPEGLIQVIPNRGALVRGPTPREVREAYLVRAELEGVAAELAVSWITDAELGKLEEAEALFRGLAEQPAGVAPGAPSAAPPPSASDADERVRAAEWVKANDLFHEVIQTAARNEQLRRSILFVYRSVPRNLTSVPITGDKRMLRRNIDEHAAIVQAIRDQDAAAARQRMKEHVLHSGEIVTNWFELRAGWLGDR
jgi:DNA-binding GntR family transcriptional regulator